jgi:hypothetical protein
MARRVVTSSVALALAAVLTASPVWAQTPAPQATQNPPPASQGTAALPVDLQKIRSVVSKSPEPALMMESMKLRFYVYVRGNPEIRFWDYVGKFDLKNGPVPKSQMTHAEFLRMVTPQELYSAAGIKPTEALEFALTGALAQWLARKAIDDIRKSQNEREIQAIRSRIERELAALTGSVIK